MSEIIINAIDTQVVSGLLAGYESSTPDILDEIHLLFSSVQSDTIEIGTQTTDHYVEDNSSKQDHIALPPIKFTLSGYVGEKVFRRSSPFVDTYLLPYLQKLTPVAALSPEVSSYMQTAITAGLIIEDVYRKYLKFYEENIKNKTLKSFFTKNQTSTISEQQAACNLLLELRANRKLVNISCDFGEFENYLITNATLTQDGTPSMSTLTVTLQEFRTVSTSVTAFNQAKYNSYVSTQKAETENIGKIQGSKQKIKYDPNKSLLLQATEEGGWITTFFNMLSGEGG